MTYSVSPEQLARLRTIGALGRLCSCGGSTLIADFDDDSDGTMYLMQQCMRCEKVFTLIDENPTRSTGNGSSDEHSRDGAVVGGA